MLKIILHDTYLRLLNRQKIFAIYALMYTVGTSVACTVLYTVFSLFRVFVFQLFKILGNTGMVAKAAKFLYLEDESSPK